LGRGTTSFAIATLMSAGLAAPACRDATAPYEPAPLAPTSSILDPILDPVTGILTGTIAVKTTTGGLSLDPNGYTVTVDLLSSKWIATNGSVTFSVVTGAHTVVLSGVASNCQVSGGNTQVVTVLLGSTASANFSVNCAATGPTTGNLTVSVATTGESPDPNGYVVTLNGGNSRTIGAPGGSNSTTYSGLSPGNYSVALNDVAGNCTVTDGRSRTVSVTAGNTSSTTFSVSCTATTPPPPPPPPPPPGGDRIAGVGGIGGGSQTFDFEATDAPGGRLRFTDASAGATLTADRASDPATGITSFTRTSTACVTFGGTGRVNTGELVSFSTEACDNGSPGVGRDVFTMSVPSQAYRVSGTLTDGEITGGGASPPPSQTGTRVTGRGAIGSGPATPGSDRLEFDFDVTSAPGGRAFVRDYSVVRSSGSAGSMTATAITSFTRTSATCVRFGGTGRLDTGEDFQFFIDACDNASPGAGADTFTITLPDRPFTHSGTVSEGDIAIAATTS
jgi:hypothetical protein